MAVASFVDVIMKVVLRPETITDGIALELPEIQQVQAFQQQWVWLILHPLKDRDQQDLQGPLLLSDEGDSWQVQVPVGFSSQTNKKSYLSDCCVCQDLGMLFFLRKDSDTFYNLHHILCQLKHTCSLYNIPLTLCYVSYNSNFLFVCLSGT